MPEPVRIAVVDDHRHFRNGVVVTLQAAPGIDVSAVGSSASDAVRIAQEDLPDIILMDIHMPGNGIMAAKEISRAFPVIKIVILTASETADDLVAALETGARGYILKGIGGPELVSNLLAIHDGEFFVTPSLAARVLSRMNEISSQLKELDFFADLTPREEQLLVQLSSGATNSEIASLMSLSEKTVKHYVQNVMQKLQVRSRVEADLIIDHELQVGA